MKHKMNPISGYYEGPPGIFYDFTHDEIFELMWRGKEVYRRDFGIVGRVYQMNHSITDCRRRTDKTTLIGMENVIYLGAV